MIMFALAIRYDLRLPGVTSLKEKRRIVRHIVDGLSSRFRIAVSEVGENDMHQRAQIGVAIVSQTGFGADKVAHQVEKFLEATHGAEIIGRHRSFIEED